MNVHGTPFPIGRSACNKCVNLMRRVVIPTDLELYGIEEKFIRENLSVADDDEIRVFQFICLVNNQELDSIVIKCNYFENNKNNNFGIVQ